MAGLSEEILRQAAWQPVAPPRVDATMRAAARFWARVEPTASCWLWRGGTSNGQPCHFTHQGRRHDPHRWAYEALVGPVPAGHRLWRVCRVVAAEVAEPRVRLHHPTGLKTDDQW